jgi:hypothetical protein
MYSTVWPAAANSLTHEVPLVAEHSRFQLCGATAAGSIVSAAGHGCSEARGFEDGVGGPTVDAAEASERSVRARKEERSNLGTN